MPSMSQPAVNSPDATPQVVCSRCILVLDDSYLKGISVKRALEDLGYKAHLACTPQQAAELMRGTQFDFAIIDGDLGDGRFDQESRSGRFIREQLGQIPYGRLSSAPELIPGDLHGKFCSDTFAQAGDWLQANLTQSTESSPTGAEAAPSSEGDAALPDRTKFA
ncbi:MAG: hypothetical protein J0M12_10700 [Deltaproteobacteria bacterium]|nr:hypothetical protein [Deltaproteobacteria bacterium]